MNQQIAEMVKRGTPGNGMSQAAGRRWQERNRGKTYTGAPGQIVKMSNRSYTVAADGSFRRNY